MHVAITTIYGCINYGNRLQNYAMQQVIKEFGCEVTTLRQPCKSQSLIKQTLKLFIKREHGKIFLQNKENRERERNKNRRRVQFVEFNRRYLNIALHGNENKLFNKKFDCNYDVFLAGSDQVWNPSFWNQREPEAEFNNYFLRFVEPEKRIAYAASFGIENLPECWKIPMGTELKKFKAISVREESGGMLVKKLTGRDVPVVLDPTMLLTGEQWREIETHNLNGNEKYVLVYFLGKQPQEVYDEIGQIAKEMTAEVINMMDNRYKYYALGPAGFLEMIDHAQILFTDSFHGTVFAILFHKPFRIFERTMPNHPSMSGRIDTLLKKTQLTECTRQKRPPTDEEFAKADMLIEKERAYSMQYLENVLHDMAYK